ncbi:MAG TPA: hypothetical protein VGK73_18910 [Polyangiaceae bacterium]
MKHRVLKRVGMAFGCAGALAAAFFGGSAFAAGIPDSETLTYAGTVLSIDGTPVSGLHDIVVEFSTSPSATSRCATSAGDVELVVGRFSIPIEDECVEYVRQNANLYVQVTVDGEAFGWSKAGAVPYAVEAGHATAADTAEHATTADEAERAAAADGADAATGPLDTRIATLEQVLAQVVPARAVMAFNLPTCPTGWAPLSGAAGRTIVGLSPGGTVLGTVGTALTDRQNRSHSHAVDPAAFTTSSTEGAHTHGVPAMQTDARDLTHTHDMNHQHEWLHLRVETDGTTQYSFYRSVGNRNVLIEWDNGIDPDDGSGLYPVATTDPGPVGTDAGLFTSQPYEHRSDTALKLQTGSPSVSLSHSHATPASTTNTQGSAHAHSINVPDTTSTTAATGDVIPYLQLLYCEKI